MADFNFSVGAEPDEASFNAAGAAAARALAQGASRSSAGNQIGKDLAADIAAQLKRVKGIEANIGKVGLDPRQFALLERGFARLLDLQRQLASEGDRLASDPGFVRGMQTKLAAVNTLVSSQTRELQSVARNADSLRNQETQKIVAQGKAAAVATQGSLQLQINAAKAAAKTRLQISRALFETIGRLENAGIRLATGAARTATGAISKIWSSTLGSVKRSMSERRTVISGGLNNETRLYQSQQARVAAITTKANRGIIGSLTRTVGLFGGGFLLLNQVKSAFTLGSQFTEGLNVLQAQLGLTEEQMKGVNKLAIQLGNDVKLPGVSALDAAQAIGLLAKQFAALGPAALPAAEAAAKGALELSRAVGTTGEQAAGAIGAAVNVFGVQAQKATDVADVLSSALSKSAGISFQDFKNSFVQAAPAFAAFEKPVEGARGAIVDFTTALAVLAKGGLFGETAGAGLKQFLIQGTKLTKEGTKQMGLLVKKAGESGTAFFTASGKARPFAQTIDIVRRGLVGYTQAQRTAALGAIFGARSINIANVLLATSTADYLKLQAAINNSTGAAEKFAAAHNKGVKGALDAIGSQLETVKIQFFEGINKPLGNAGLAIANFISNILTSAGNWAIVRKGLLGVAAGLGAVLVFKGGVEALQLLGKVLPLLITPMGILTLLAAGLGAAFFIASDKSKSFKDTMEKLKTGAIDLAQKGVKFLGDQLAKLGPFLEKTVIPAFEKLKEFATTAIGPLVKRVKELGQAVLNFLKPAIDVVKMFGKALVDVGKELLAGNFSQAFNDIKVLAGNIAGTITNAISNIDFGAIGKALSSKLGRALVGGGVGAALGGLVAGPFGAALGAALGAAVALALPAIGKAIASINVASLFGALLDKVRAFAKLATELILDKRVILAAAGLVAIGAALAGELALGVIQGLVAAVPGITSALSTIFKTIFKLPSIVQSILALAVLWRTGLLKIPSSIRPAAIQAGQQIGQNVSEGVASAKSTNSFAQAFANLAAKVKGGAIKIGQVLGTSVAIGLSAALSGSALGTATSGVEKGLAGAGIAASAAAAFQAGSVLSGGNALVGAGAAAATVAVAGLTAVLSHNAKAHAEAAASARDFANALQDEGDITQTLIGNLKGATPEVSAGLASMNVHLADFQKALESGKGDDFIKNLEKNLTLDPFVSSSAIPAIKFLKDQVKAYASGVKEAGNEEKVMGKTATDSFGHSANAAEAMAKATKDAASAARNADFGKKIEEFNNKASTLRTLADDAREALRKLFEGKTTNITATTNAGVLDVKQIGTDVQEGIATGINTATGSAQVQTALGRLGGVVGDIVSSPGATAATIATSLKKLKQGIGEQFGFSITSQTLNKAVDDALAKLGTPEVKAALKVIADDESKASAAQTSATLIAEIQKNFPAVSAKAAADIASAVQAGADVSTLVGGQYVPVDATVNPNTGQAAGAGTSLANAVADGFSRAGNVLGVLGGNIVQGLVNGINNAAPAAADAAAAAARAAHLAAAKALGISSPSKVFIAIGQETMEGFAKGIKDGSSDVVSTAEDIAKKIIDLSRSAFQRLGAAQVSGRDTIFDAIFGGTAAAAARAFETARGAITTGFQSLKGQVQQNNLAILQAAQVKPGERTIADQLTLQAKANSLALTDQFGIANRSAIVSAVQAVEDFGKALLDQGNSVTSVVKQLQSYRAILIATAKASGLNVTQATQLVDSLGLSNAQLTNFLNLAKQAGIEISAGAGTKPASKTAGQPKLITGPNPVGVVINGGVNLTLPHGDPEAVSLAVVNRLALGIRR